MGHGGKRAGAGKPKGSRTKKTIHEAEARAILVKKVLTKWEPIIDTMMALALGQIKVARRKKLPSGQTIDVVYTKAPSEKMLQNLSEMLVGRAVQPISGGIDLPQLDQLSNDIRTILSKK